MNKLIDNTEVSNKSFNFLSEWVKEDNYKEMIDAFNKTNLSDLTIDEYLELWKSATHDECLKLFTILLENEKKQKD